MEQLIPLESPASGPEPTLSTSTATAYPTLKESWAFLGWFLLVCVVMAIPFGVLLAVTKAGTSAYALLFTLLIDIVLLGFLYWKAGPRWQPLQVAGQEKAGVYICLPVVVISLMVVLSVFHWLHLPNWASDTFKKATLSPALALLVGGLLAPILEEVLFRGVLLQGLLRNYRPWVAIGQSALLFSIIHFNPAQSVPTFFMGLLLGWLFYRTRSLLVCMAIHIINNSVAFGMMIWSPQLEKMNSMAELFGSVEGYLAALAGALVVLGLFLWQIQRTTPAAE